SHTHTLTHSHSHTHTHTHTRTHAHTLTHSYPHTHTHTHSHICFLSPAHKLSVFLISFILPDSLSVDLALVQTNCIPISNSLGCVRWACQLQMRTRSLN